MKVLLTGVAGYIGSVVAEQLVANGHEVVGVDDLRHGYVAAIHPQVRFERGDLCDRSWLLDVLGRQPIDAVVHLAAEALIDESIRNPGLFYRVNVSGGLNLLDAMVESGVERLVFSSTAAVYGQPSSVPIREDAACVPVNAYGESKLAFERMLPWYARAHALRYITLRYFNACGATDRYGEDHRPETHLIPMALAVAAGRHAGLHLYGADYDTADGTCIRDYIHVVDIARAHLLALEGIDRLGGTTTFNMGNGTGYSNKEVVATVERVTGCEVKVIRADRRAGDPARLVADSEALRRAVGWEPEYPALSAMVESAWRWMQAHPGGYEG